MQGMPEVSVTAVQGTVAGRVQGVGFRWSAARRATRLDLAGWVRNLPDGRVEILVQGNSGDVAAMLRFLRLGPSAAQVTSTDLSPIEADPTLSEFSIR